MLAEIAALGFEHVELSHGIRLSLVPGIVRALEEKLIKVSTTHNFCPLPPGVSQAAPNMFMPSSADGRVCSQWDRYTRRSIDFAQQVGAALVVTHLGEVEWGWFNPASRVYRLTHGKNGESPGHARKVHAASRVAMNKLMTRKGTFWEGMLRRLGPILEYARSRGVSIGGENREKVEELPFESDFPNLLERFGPDSGLVAWHDTGHAHLKEKMGLIRQEELLTTNAPRLAGFHLHDVRGYKDHVPPGTGEIDFGMVARFVRPEHILVLELNPRLNPTDVVESRSYIVEKFGLG
ncbi:MAG: sugar phosphate isomerase/epimerase family protein [Opitutaceae bacterium]